MKRFFYSVFPLLIALFAQGSALIPAKIEERATCASGTFYDGFLDNDGFYGYPNQFSYAPWNVTHTSGNGSCKYITGYTTCMDTYNGGNGKGDPSCFACGYDANGGSDTISQTVTGLTPGCNYTLDIDVACDTTGYSFPDSEGGKPHVFFRVTLDHQIIVQQQLSCNACTSNQQPGCSQYPYPTYRRILAPVTAPPSGQGTIKIITSQAPQSAPALPFMITDASLY